MNYTGSAISTEDDNRRLCPQCFRETTNEDLCNNCFEDLDEDEGFEVGEESEEL